MLGFSFICAGRRLFDLGFNLNCCCLLVLGFLSVFLTFNFIQDSRLITHWFIIGRNSQRMTDVDCGNLL